MFMMSEEMFSSPIITLTQKSPQASTKTFLRNQENHFEFLFLYNTKMHYLEICLLFIDIFSKIGKYICENKNLTSQVFLFKAVQ